MKVLVTSELECNHYSMTVMYKNKRFKLSTCNGNSYFHFNIEIYTATGLAQIANEYDIMGVEHVSYLYDKEERTKLNEKNMVFGLEYIKLIF